MDGGGDEDEEEEEEKEREREDMMECYNVEIGVCGRK